MVKKKLLEQFPVGESEKPAELHWLDKDECALPIMPVDDRVAESLALVNELKKDPRKFLSYFTTPDNSKFISDMMRAQSGGFKSRIVTSPGVLSSKHQATMRDTLLSLDEINHHYPEAQGIKRFLADTNAAETKLTKVKKVAAVKLPQKHKPKPSKLLLKLLQHKPTT